MTFNGLVPEMRAAAQALYDWARREGLQPQVTSVRRTRAQQARLYRRYLQGVSPFPAAPPGRSLHEYGYAFDMVTRDPAATGAAWRQMGGSWFESDWPHFQARTG